MEGEIITIGDELMTGRVCDLNSFFLSARISSYGLRIKAFSTVGDAPDDIVDVLSRAVDRSDFVLVSGGLGPTDDDITTEVAADFFRRRLILDREFLDTIKEALRKWGAPWVEAYRKLAFVPEGAVLIAPEEACGFYLFHGRVPVFFLPGVPAEVRRLTETRVLPFLVSHFGAKAVVRQRLFKLFGPQEAQIGEILNGVAEREKGVMLGFYPNFPENHVTVTVRAASEKQAEETLTRVETEVEERLGAFVVAKDGDTLEESVGRSLRRRGLTVAVAESCTGGLISRRLTSISGSSDYFMEGLVTYSNAAKTRLLNVPPQVIETHGAVSEQTARLMAEGARAGAGTDIGLATTGIAGPTGGTDEKPVGTVYISLAGPDGTLVRRHQFLGQRDQITQLTAQTALNWLHGFLDGDADLFRD